MAQAMKGSDSHRRLLTLLCLMLLASSSLLLLSGCASTLLPQQDARAASRFTRYDQVIDAFEQITPGQTREEDLPNIGFDARTGNVDVLSYLGIEERFLPRAGVRFADLDPAVRRCIRAELYCTGYVFHPALSASQRIGSPFMDLMGFERVTHSEHWSAEIILLVQDGHVVHKVFSGNPRTENLEQQKQPLGPLQDLGGAL